MPQINVSVFSLHTAEKCVCTGTHLTVRNTPVVEVTGTDVNTVYIYRWCVRTTFSDVPGTGCTTGYLVEPRHISRNMSSPERKSGPFSPAVETAKTRRTTATFLPNASRHLDFSSFISESNQFLGQCRVHNGIGHS